MNELDAYTRERDKLRAWVEAEPGHAFGLDVGADDELTSVVARVLPAVRPGDRATDAPSTLRVAGVPAGVRLVIAALVSDGGSVADPATLRLAWVPVADPGTDPTPR